MSSAPATSTTTSSSRQRSTQRPSARGPFEERRLAELRRAVRRAPRDDVELLAEEHLVARARACPGRARPLPVTTRRWLPWSTMARVPSSVGTTRRKSAGCHGGEASRSSSARSSSCAASAASQARRPCARASIEQQAVERGTPPVAASAPRRRLHELQLLLDAGRAVADGAGDRRENGNLRQTGCGMRGMVISPPTESCETWQPRRVTIPCDQPNRGGGDARSACASLISERDVVRGGKAEWCAGAMSSALKNGLDAGHTAAFSSGQWRRRQKSGWECHQPSISSSRLRSVGPRCTAAQVSAVNVSFVDAACVCGAAICAVISTKSSPATAGGPHVMVQARPAPRRSPRRQPAARSSSASSMTRRGRKTGTGPAGSAWASQAPAARGTAASRRLRSSGSGCTIGSIAKPRPGARGLGCLGGNA